MSVSFPPTGPEVNQPSAVCHSQNWILLVQRGSESLLVWTLWQQFLKLTFGPIILERDVWVERVQAAA